MVMFLITMSFCRVTALSLPTLAQGQRNPDTRLLDAIANDDWRTAKLLLSKGASPTTRDRLGYTPLYLASSLPAERCAAVLLAAKADPNAREGSTGQTPLMAACRHPAFYSPASKKYLSVAKQLLSAGARVDMRDNEGFTALHHSAVFGNCDEVRLLLAHGADARAPDKHGMTAADGARAALAHLERAKPGTGKLDERLRADLNHVVELLEAAAEPPARTSAETRARFHRLIDRPRVSLEPEARVEEKEGLTVTRGSFRSEATERVPFLLLEPADRPARIPAVIVLHGTGGNKEGTEPVLRELADHGLAAIVVDGRFHGARIPGGAHGATEYNEAIVAAWREKDPKKQAHPFYFDTVYDVWRTVDYLQSRPDIDPNRIGLIGFSKGGIETWLAAATDERIRVAVPCIAVQSLKWSLENECWQGRANTIRAAHEAVAKDLGEPEVNARVCRALWDKVVPGILSDFDCPNMLRAIAPRPLLVIGGDRDPNCPVEGARIAIEAARREYARLGASDRIDDDIAPGVAHQVTDAQRARAINWLVRWLKEK